MKAVSIIGIFIIRLTPVRLQPGLLFTCSLSFLKEMYLSPLFSPFGFFVWLVYLCYFGLSACLFGLLLDIPMLLNDHKAVSLNGQ